MYNNKRYQKNQNTIQTLFKEWVEASAILASKKN